MRTLARLVLAGAVAAAAGAGCDYGTTPQDESVVQSALLDPSSSTTSGAQGLGVPSNWSATPADDPDEPASESAPAQVAGRPASADCIDFTTGAARLIPCSVRRTLSNPVGHDDPDPWRPAPNPAKPY